MRIHRMLHSPASHTGAESFLPEGHSETALSGSAAAGSFFSRRFSCLFAPQTTRVTNRQAPPYRASPCKTSPR